MLIVSLIVFEVIFFFGLIFILQRIMSKNVTSATTHLEELSQEYALKEQEVNRQLEEAKQKSQELLTKAQEEAEGLKEQIIKEAEGERDKMINQARTQSEEIMQQADRSRQVLLSEINERVNQEAIERACELIQYTLPEHFKQDVHLHWVEELIESGFSNLERLNIPQGNPEVKIVSAFSLSDAQRKILFKKLKEKLGYDAAIKEEVDPKIVAGIIITIGSLVLDGSLKNKVQEKAKSA